MISIEAITKEAGDNIMPQLLRTWLARTDTPEGKY